MSDDYANRLVAVINAKDAQIEKMRQEHASRISQQDAVVVNPDHLTGQDDGIAYSGCVGGFRGSLSHHGYLARERISTR
jgi:hypothetical protein